MQLGGINIVILIVASGPCCCLLLNFRKPPLFSDRSHATIRYFFFLQKVGVACATCAYLVALAANDDEVTLWTDNPAILYAYAAVVALLTYRLKSTYPPQFDGWLISYFKVRVEELTPYRFKLKPPPKISPVFTSADDRFEPITYPFSRLKQCTLLLFMLSASALCYYTLEEVDDFSDVEYFICAAGFGLVVCAVIPVLFLNTFSPGQITIHPEYIEIETATVPPIHIPWNFIESFDLGGYRNASSITIRGKGDGQVLYHFSQGVKGYRHVELHSLLNQWLELYKQREARHNAS